MEEAIFKYGKYSYKYFLVRQSRKTVSLTVQPNFRIILKCPINYEDDKIQKFLKKKWSWLEKQLKYFKKYKKNIFKKEYVSGESFLYLGRQYMIIVKKGESDGVKLEKGRLNIITTGKAGDLYYNKYILNKWYRDRMGIIFKEEYDKVLEKFDLSFIPKITIKKMDKLWGSYLGSKKKIVLNPQLVQSSRECISYVITHELSHMNYKNHDARFYKLLKSKINNWEDVKDKLEMGIYFMS